MKYRNIVKNVIYQHYFFYHLFNIHITFNKKNIIKKICIKYLKLKK